METLKSLQGENDCSDEINNLEGMEEFKLYITQLKYMSNYLRKWNSKKNFPIQHMLWSINTGDGCSTAAQILFKTIKSMKLFYVSGDIFTKTILQEYTFQYSDNPDIPMEATLERFRAVAEATISGVMVIHIEDWIDKIETRVFRRFMDICNELINKIVFVFVIPYVDEGVLNRVFKALEERLNILTIRFVPYCDKQLLSIAKNSMKQYDIKWDETSDRPFCRLLNQERSKQRFYGIKTVKNLIIQLVRAKIKNSEMKINDSPFDVLTEKDFNAFFEDCIKQNPVSGQHELEAMIGLEDIKKRVEELVVSIQYEKQMYEKGLKSSRPCYHMMFTGNPGTGKTEVARLIGKIFREKGLLPVGDLLEVNRFDLVGDYIGQTGPKTINMCRAAYGSVLFIDEAYLLAVGDKQKNNRDFGAEAIGALVAEMENNRDKLVVILAGYKDEMERLCEMNVGLRNRIPHKFHFENYTRRQLFEIFVYQLKDYYVVDEDFMSYAKDYFENLSDKIIDSKQFGNARFVRNLVERIRNKSLLRQAKHKEDITDKICLMKVDFETAVLDADICSLNERNNMSEIGYIYTRRKELI